MLSPPDEIIINFINLFDSQSWLDEQGRVGWLIEDEEDEYASPLNAAIIGETFSQLGFLSLGLVAYVPEQLEKMNFKIFQDDREDKVDHWALFNLAPALGLPGIQPKQELEELKHLFLYLKDLAWAEPEQKWAVTWYREFEDYGVSLSGNNKVRAIEETQKLNDKIKRSPVLTQWFNNTIQGIKNQRIPNSVLWSTTSLSKLIELKDQEAYFLKSQGVNSLEEFKAKKKVVRCSVRRRR